MLSKQITLFPHAVHIFKTFVLQGSGERVWMGDTSVEENLFWGNTRELIVLGEEKAMIQNDSLYLPCPFSC